MIASASSYPSFLESLFTRGPGISEIMQVFFFLFVLSFLPAAVFLWCRRSSSMASTLLIWAPSVIGSILAGFQSMSAEFIVRANQAGIVYWSRPDRYIGHIRIFLCIGLSMSLALLCIHFLALRRQNRNEHSA